MAKPPVIADLVWTEALRFDATSARISTVIDGDSNAGPSPVQMLVLGSGISFADRGEHALKGVPGQWHLFAAMEA